MKIRIIIDLEKDDSTENEVIKQILKGWLADNFKQGNEAKIEIKNEN